MTAISEDAKNVNAESDVALLPGRILVKCPRTGKDVNVRKICAGQRCDHYKHISWEGLRPLIGCDYEKFERMESSK